MPLSRLAPMVLLCAGLALSACKTADQQAEEFYQAGLSLLQAGDKARALVEFRNVFRLNGRHKDARLAYARTERQLGDEQEAYSQYLRVIEQYPDTAEARLALAELAIDRNDWAEAERHGRAAVALDPTNPAVRAVGAALDYRTALLAKDRAAEAAPVAVARDVLARLPGNLVARRLVIDYLASGDDPTLALPEIDAGIAAAPAVIDLHLMKLRILSQAGRVDAMGQELHAANTQFPDNVQLRGLLVAWYLDRKDFAGAQAFLQSLAAKAGNDPSPRLSIVEFLGHTQGPDAALAEVNRLIALNDGNLAAYRQSRAGLYFDSGQHAEAIVEMQAILVGAAAGIATDDLKVMLARMLVADGQTGKARAVVTEVLASDPTHVEALKLKAGWQITDDQPGDAILTLRTALDQAPRDAAILTLMAVAHERDGSHALAGERLALAVEVSGRAAAESLRYAQFLMADGRRDVAQGVLEDAVRVAPANSALLAALGDVAIDQGDWPRAAVVVAALRQFGAPVAKAQADRIEATSLFRQNRMADTASFLQGIAAAPGADGAALAAMVQAQVQAGQIGAATTYVDRMLTATPRDRQLRYLRAGLHVLAGEGDKAEALYRGLIAEDATQVGPAEALYAMLVNGRRGGDATAVLDAAILARPADIGLRISQAGALEGAGDIAGAIAVYEAAYALDSGDLIVANNLASLLASYRDDEASLARAALIARRLHGRDVPAFQDTYGWIAYRRGNFDDAIASLEPAAKGLPQDAMVRLHLGLAYAAANRKDDARRTLQQALEVAGTAAGPEFAKGREALAKLASGG